MPLMLKLLLGKVRNVMARRATHHWYSPSFTTAWLSKNSTTMKKLLSAVAALWLMFFSQGCDEEFEARQQPVRIGFTISSPDGITAALPKGSRLLMSVETLDGAVLREFDEVDPAHHGEGYLVQPFSLTSGTYRITNFAIVDGAGEMLYAVPRTASRLAHVVPQPLDFEFRVHEDGNPVELNFRLLDTRRYKPEDFGYPIFHLVRGFLLLLVTEEGSHKPLPAKVAVMDGTRTISEYNLRASMNRIPLPSGITNDYRLVIVSDGYAKAEYNLFDLLKANPFRIVKVALHPAFTMLAFVEQGSPFEFDLGAVGGGSISIDWGDGIVESHALQPQSANDRVSHLYSGSGNYSIAISGDLDHITFLSSAYGQSMMDAVNFQHLKNLQEITMALTRSPRVIDLRANTMLETVSLVAVEVETLYLPRVHKITLLGLGPMPMPADGVDAIIDNMYANVRSQNIRSGQLSLRASWEDETLLGPPSTSSLNKMRSMRDDYGWILYPDPFPSGE